MDVPIAVLLDPSYHECQKFHIYINRNGKDALLKMRNCDESR